MTLLQLFPSLDASFVERGIVKEKWEPAKKPSNLIKKAGEEN